MASVRDFGAKGNGVADDSPAIQHAVEQGDGEVLLPRGEYLLNRTVIVPLDRVGRFAIRGTGSAARLFWVGSGPALHLVGTRKRTADQKDFAEGVWQKERMPTLSGLEIVGLAAESDAVRSKLDDSGYRAAIQVDSASTAAMIVNNFLAKGTDGDLHSQAGDQCQSTGNLPL
jgi:hypothetical protein